MEWQSTIQTLYNRFLLSLGLCDLCGNDLHTKLTPQQTLICSSCLTDLPLFKQDIIQGDLLNWPAVNHALPNIHFDQLISLSPYLSPFTQWLPQLKYQGRFELSSLFAYLLAMQWQQKNLIKIASTVDLILCVPLHISKWQVRGYNQAHLIAKSFAQHIQKPYDDSALIRTQNTESQVGQTGNQRRNNLYGAFKLVKELPSNTKHIILIDDVLTTGSTASEISKLLKGFGVRKVTIVTICLTLPKSKIS
jgi:ComF family protein